MHCFMDIFPPYHTYIEYLHCKMFMHMYQLFPVDRQEEALTGYSLKGQMVTIVPKISKVNGRLKQKIFFNISVMCLPSIH